MIRLRTPNGIEVDVPEKSGEDISKKFGIHDTSAAKKYFKEFGYVVFKKVFDERLCSEVKAAWDQELKPSNRYIYRQATARSEKNKYNDNGWVMNPILNLQSLNPRRFGKLRSTAVNEILCNDMMRDLFTKFLNQSPKIVQSMYFEGNSETWEHQDSYYLDSEKLGSMVAAWIALEDINARAGRFFICPGTHRLELERQSQETNVADNHHVYIKNVVDLMKKNKMEIRAPKLDAGDVLMWHAYTIHGSLKSDDPSNSRSSITVHAIPSSHLFMQLQSRVLDVDTDVVNGVHLWRPKDQSKFLNKLILLVESYLPGPFYWLKRTVIKKIVK